MRSISGADHTTPTTRPRKSKRRMCFIHPTDWLMPLFSNSYTLQQTISIIISQRIYRSRTFGMVASLRWSHLQRPVISGLRRAIPEICLSFGQLISCMDASGALGARILSQIRDLPRLRVLQILLHLPAPPGLVDSTWPPYHGTSSRQIRCNLRSNRVQHAQ